jgi:hypothetical protein
LIVVYREAGRKKTKWLSYVLVVVWQIYVRNKSA